MKECIDHHAKQHRLYFYEVCFMCCIVCTCSVVMLLPRENSLIRKKYYDIASLEKRKFLNTFDYFVHIMNVVATYYHDTLLSSFYWCWSWTAIREELNWFWLETQQILTWFLYYYFVCCYDASSMFAVFKHSLMMTCFKFILC